MTYVCVSYQPTLFMFCSTSNPHALEERNTQWTYQISENYAGKHFHRLIILHDNLFKSKQLNNHDGHSIIPSLISFSIRESSNLRIFFKISRECSPSKGGGECGGEWQFSSSFSSSNEDNDNDKKSSNSTAGPIEKKNHQKVRSYHF